MPRFLIVLPHEDDHVACVRALQAVESYGSHFMTHSYWGCPSGDHSGCMIGEFANREEALQVVPPQFRAEARIIEVVQYTKDKIEAMVAKLKD